MADQIALRAEVRDGAGKGEARRLRRAGRVPAIAYGSELQATALAVDARDLMQALRTDAGLNAIIRLEFDDTTQLALTREIQRHPVRRDILHVDFVAISRTEKVTADIPIHLEGEAPGVNDGGIAEQPLYTLSVEVLPLEMPDQIVVDISDMDIGDVKRVADLDLPDGVTPLEDPESTVVTVYFEAAEVAEEDEDLLEEGMEAAEAAEEAPAAGEDEA